VGMQL